MRRRIREFFRNEQWKIEPGWDFVVNAQGPLEKATTPDLAAELRRLIARGIRSARTRRDSPNSESGSKEPKRSGREAKKPTKSRTTATSKSPAPDGRS